MYRYEFLTEGARKSGWRAAHASELPSVFGISDPRFRQFAFAGETDAAVAQGALLVRMGCGVLTGL
jgi:para-nitrobenzyl esterase